MANKMLFGYNFGKLSIAVIPAYQDRADKEDWKQIDPNSLPEDMLAAYELYREASREAGELRKAFEDKVKAAAGFKAEAKPAPKGAVSLASFLGSQANSGRNA
jgi:TPP-dependent pyruvate/acetoin dehydrogenase alpha subunit